MTVTFQTVPPALTQAQFNTERQAFCDALNAITSTGIGAGPYTYLIRKSGAVYEAYNSSATLIYGGASDAGGVDGDSFPAVYTAAIAGGGKIYLAEGTYTGNITCDVSRVITVGAGRGTIIDGDFTLGTVAARKEMIGAYNLTVTGTISFIRLNDGVYGGDNIFAANFVSQGNWGINFGTILLQGGTGSIFLNDVEAGATEYNTCTTVKNLLIEDNLADTDIGVENTANNQLFINNLHVESALGLTNHVKNNGLLHVDYGSLAFTTKADAGATSLLANGTVTGNFYIDTGSVVEKSIILGGSYCKIYAKLGQGGATGDVSITGSDNELTVYTVNTVNLYVTGDNNKISGSWHSVGGRLTNTGDHNNLDDLVWLQHGTPDTTLLFVNSGASTTIDDAEHINHGLYGYYGYTPTIIAVGSDGTSSVSISGIGETDFVVNIKDLDGGGAGATQTVYWLGRTFPR